MILLMILIILFIIVFIQYKYKKKYLEFFWNEKSKSDVLAHKNMNCKEVKKIMRPDLGAGVFIQIVDDSCFEGLPHTLDVTTIVIPSSLYEKGGIELNDVLKHEQVHLMQRNDIMSWKQFYDRFKWKIYNKLWFEIPKDLFERIRFNPDTSNERYGIWNQRYLFLSCYKDSTYPQIKESELIIYDLEDKRVLERGTFPPDYYDWMKINQADHPHEIFAELMSEPSKIMKIDEKSRYGVQNFYNLQKEKLFVD